MHLTPEEAPKNSIRTYDQQAIYIGDDRYDSSVIVSHQKIIPWEARSLSELTIDNFTPFKEAEVILLSESPQCTKLRTSLIVELSKQKLGLEVMTLGALCRTYNLLLLEGRKVYAGIIFTQS